MREVDAAGLEDMLESPSCSDQLAATDVAAFVYDSSDAKSFQAAYQLLLRVATASGDALPCLFIAAKDDLVTGPVRYALPPQHQIEPGILRCGVLEALCMVPGHVPGHHSGCLRAVVPPAGSCTKAVALSQDLEQETTHACASLAMRMPISVSMRVGETASIFSQLVSTASSQELSIPETPSLKVWWAHGQDWHRAVMLCCVPHAAGLAVCNAGIGKALANKIGKFALAEMS